MIRPRSGRVLGEDGGADKALRAWFCRCRGKPAAGGRSGAARRDKNPDGPVSRHWNSGRKCGFAGQRERQFDRSEPPGNGNAIPPLT